MQKQEKKGMQKVFLISLIFIVMLIVLQSTHYFLSDTEFLPQVQNHIDTEKIEKTILEYLVKQGDDRPVKYYANEKTFVSMSVFLLEGDKSKTCYNVYAWIVEDQYYSEGDSIQQGGGSSGPRKFTVEYADGKFIITNVIQPRDGYFYQKDIEKIFPDIIRKSIDKIYEDNTIEKLSMHNARQAEAYFRK